MKRYRIELTEEQMGIIARCLEDIHRFLAGQCDMDNTMLYFQDRSKARVILRQLEPTLFPELPANSSYGWDGLGCPDKQRGEMIAKTYSIYRDIYHQLALDGNWQNVYSSETLRCKTAGIPIKITRI